jgi:hypothetical protein
MFLGDFCSRTFDIHRYFDQQRLLLTDGKWQCLFKLDTLSTWKNATLHPRLAAFKANVQGEAPPASRQHADALGCAAGPVAPQPRAPPPPRSCRV